MGAFRFATTQLRGLQAAGRTADLQHGLISAVLARHLGEAYAELLCEFEVRDSDTRDWFVNAPPAPVPVSNLPEEDQSAIRGRADEMVAAVRSLADRIESQGAQGRNMARVLRDAAVYPAADLWLFRGSPLIINWGYHSTDAVARVGEAISVSLRLPTEPDPDRPTDRRPEPPAPTPIPATANARRFWPLASAALLWIVFVFALARIYSDLLPACGIWQPFPLFGRSVGACPVIASNDAAFREGIRLQRRIEQAELDVAKQRQACAAGKGRRAAIDGLSGRVAAYTPVDVGAGLWGRARWRLAALQGEQ